MNSKRLFIKIVCLWEKTCIPGKEQHYNPTFIILRGLFRFRVKIWSRGKTPTQKIGWRHLLAIFTKIVFVTKICIALFNKYSKDIKKESNKYSKFVKVCANTTRIAKILIFHISEGNFVAHIMFLTCKQVRYIFEKDNYLITTRVSFVEKLYFLQVSISWKAFFSPRRWMHFLMTTWMLKLEES